MTFPARLTVALFSLLLCGGGVACASGHKKPQSSDREKLVPEETQQRSKENYGRQGMSMDSLNMTPSEQAGMQHENATRPVEREGREKK